MKIKCELQENIGNGITRHKPILVGQEIVVWFSCGAASAIAAKKTIELYGDFNNVRLVNNPVLEEDEDNRRFLKDVESWLGQEIEIATNSEYSHCSAEQVWDDRSYMAGRYGAPCTMLLKKGARYEFESKNHIDWHVLGFTSDEKKRSDKFMAGERSNLIPVLIDNNITKQDCFTEILRAGIELPKSYRLGFYNANCYGCVKVSSPTYWNHLRKVKPNVFKKRAEMSRRIGARLVIVKGERIFLDELEPHVVGRKLQSIDFDCGIFCEEK